MKSSRHRRIFITVALLALPAAAVLLGSSDSRSWSLLGNTFLLALGVCAVSLPLAVALALLLFRSDVPGRRMAMALLGAMLFVPLYLQAAAWDAGFGLQGWFSLAFAELGAPPLLRGWYGAVWVHAMAAIPWAVLIIGVGLRFLPAELEEQALLDATPLATLWHVTLPRVLSSVAVASLWILVTTAGEMTVTDIFQVRTFAEELYIGFALGEPAMGGGLVGAPLHVLPSVTVMACLIAAALCVFVFFIPPDDVITVRRPPRVFRLGPWRWVAGLLIVVTLLVLVGVPIGNLVYKAGVFVQQEDAGRVRSWTLAKALMTIADSPGVFRRELVWSLQIAITVAILTTVAAVPLAWFGRSRSWRTFIVLLMLAFFMALPGPLIGLGIIQLLNQRESDLLVFLYDRTIFAPCLSMWVKALPLVSLMMWYGLRSIPQEMLDAAELDGAGSLARLVRVALPQRVPLVVAGFLVAMALAMGDLAASILVVPPGVTTLAIRIFTLVHYGVEDQPAGICLCAFALFVVIAASAFAALTWRRPE